MLLDIKLTASGVDFLGPIWSTPVIWSVWSSRTWRIIILKHCTSNLQWLNFFLKANAIQRILIAGTTFRRTGLYVYTMWLNGEYYTNPTLANM